MPELTFFNSPGKYLQWAVRAKPAIFWSMVVGCMGPVILVAAPPVRRMLGDTVGRPQIPLTYPIPKGPRNPPSGYDD